MPLELPAYQVNPDGAAVISECGLTEFVAGDAWFCAIGLVVGIGLGGHFVWKKVQWKARADAPVTLKGAPG